jgi:hypothetical protein
VAPWFRADRGGARSEGRKAERLDGRKDSKVGRQ